MSVFNKHRGTQQDALDELKILAKLEHDHILRYYHSWSDPSEYHNKERDRILFIQSEISRSVTSTTGGYQPQLGHNVRVASSRGEDLNDMIVFKPSSRNIPKCSNVDTSLSEKEGQNKSEPYEYLFIVTSLCNKMTLADRLSREYRSVNQITRFDALYIFSQIVEGVRYLHDNMNVVTLYFYLCS
jgi:serine/threonine protein kinase